MRQVRVSILGDCERRSERGDCVDEMTELDVIPRSDVPDGHHGAAAGAGARKGTVGMEGMTGMEGIGGIVTLGMLGMAGKGGNVTFGTVGTTGIGGTASFGTVGTTGIGDGVGSEGGSAAGASAVSSKWRAASHVMWAAKMRDARKLIL
ncbi:hypothetical protein BHE74_00003328 [Ensete ventricosum]|nr:hypothetical protein BHE74_00003328 [Ensete ventricosum]